MLHECGNQYGGVSPALAPCTCGLLYGSCGGGCGAGAAASAFSLLFPVAGGHYKQCSTEEGGHGSYGTAVDCTLSLGTPSTRRAEEGSHGPGLAWDVVSGCGSANGKPESGGVCKESSAGGGGAAISGGLLARRCANCDTTSTPLWRNGPRGPKSLCNACGIRYKKEERRAAAAAAPTPSDSGIGYGYGYARQQQQQWGCYGSAAAKTASFAMFGDVETAEDGPCLSWRLNVMPTSPAFTVRERPSLFQYY